MNAEPNIRNLSLFILAFLLVFTAALSIDVMDVDAAQYATIARQMAQSDNWLQVMDRGHDYLDKPPLLFWLAASGFKLFGISNWAYKLPSFLFALLGIFSTVRLGQLLYDRKTGLLAGLMLASGFGMFVMINDVRTDTILLGSVAFAVWQILLYLKTKRRISLLAGFAGIGAAMLAKGPLGLVIPVMALSCEFAYKRQWRNFVRWEWLPGLIVTALIIFPMCLGLYQQFDLHPEKTVNGSTGVSGLRFFFWTQSFGRITGESDWGTKFDNGAGPFFFTHTFLWSFFPWSFLVVGGLLKTIVKLIRSRFRPGYLPEMLSTGGFVLIFLAMSASRYKLPHYIYVTFPFAAILAARFFVYDIFHVAKRYLRIVFGILHAILVPALFAAVVLFLFVIFSGAPAYAYIVAAAWLLAAVLFAWKAQTLFEKLLYPLLSGLLAFYFVAYVHFYPNLLHYQGTATAGRIVAESGAKQDEYFYYNDVFQYPGDFYSGLSVYNIYPDQLERVMEKGGEIWIYTDRAGLDELKAKPYRIVYEKKIDDYSVQFLTTNFLDPAKRSSVIRERYLLRLKKDSGIVF